LKLKYKRYERNKNRKIKGESKSKRKKAKVPNWAGPTRPIRRGKPGRTSVVLVFKLQPVTFAVNKAVDLSPPLPSILVIVSF
jgi:hypothetical protein